MRIMHRQRRNHWKTRSWRSWWTRDECGGCHNEWPCWAERLRLWRDRVQQNAAMAEQAAAARMLTEKTTELPQVPSLRPPLPEALTPPAGRHRIVDERPMLGPPPGYEQVRVPRAVG